MATTSKGAAIAANARIALKASGFPTTNHLCQKWARLVVKKVFGNWPGGDIPASAVIAARQLLRQGKAFLYRGQTLQPGDLLYKTVGSGESGHVGIYLGNNQVAENSTVHWNRSGHRDARGIRTLKEFGPFQVVARFK